MKYEDYAKTVVQKRDLEDAFENNHQYFPMLEVAYMSGTKTDVENYPDYEKRLYWSLFNHN